MCVPYSLILNLPMRKPLSPLQAFATDASGADTRRVNLGTPLREWLSVAHAAEVLSFSLLSPAVDDIGRARREMAAFEGRRPSMIHDAQPAPTESVALLAEQFRVAAEEMEEAGCYELAFTTVSAICRVVAQVGPGPALLATLHLGRIARQMNDLTTAEECYDEVVRRATRTHDSPLAARGQIGRALLHDMRGNMPAAEAAYRKALQLATPKGGAYLMACNGLVTLAINRGALGDALLFGWQLYDASAQGSETRMVSLYELSVVALQAGFPEPAMRGFRQALELAPPARLRISFLGGAIRAAAQLGEVAKVCMLRTDIDRAIAEANQPHDAAGSLLHAADALFAVGKQDDARRTIAACRMLADRFDYHEYTFRADTLEASWRGNDVLTTHSTDVGSPKTVGRRAVDRAFTEGIRRLAALA